MIKKGKAHKAIEFGRIDRVQNGIVSNTAMIDDPGRSRLQVHNLTENCGVE